MSRPATPAQLACALVIALAAPTALALSPLLGEGAADPTAPTVASDPAIREAVNALPQHGLVLGAGYDPDGPADHGFHSCGEEIALVFLNPDLRVQSDGYVHASGFFFIQFQAIGEKALEIEKFQFSFGKPIPPSGITCDTPEWVTGAYLKGYRADDNPADGFFVPINTTNVPDGEYAAAVSAFDSDGVELTRYYVSAMVENGCPYGYRDPACPGTYVSKDKVMPWPMVLPGDGEQTNSVGGLTVEFAEPLRAKADGNPDIEIYLNKILQSWTPFDVPLRDDDVVPDNPFAPSAIQTRKWGPGMQVATSVRNGDIIRVVAYDLNNNRVEKILHIGDSTIGGRIELSAAELVIEGDGMAKTANDSIAYYSLAVKNTGKGSAHGNLIVDQPPENLRASFDNDHITIGEGQTHFANLTVIALEGLSPGSYDISGYATYKKGDIEEKKPFKVKFVLEETSNITQSEFQNKAASGDLPQAPPTPVEAAEEEVPEKKRLPAPAAVLALAIVGAAAAARRKR